MSSLDTALQQGFTQIGYDQTKTTSVPIIRNIERLCTNMGFNVVIDPQYSVTDIQQTAGLGVCNVNGIHNLLKDCSKYSIEENIPPVPTITDIPRAFWTSGTCDYAKFGVASNQALNSINTLINLLRGEQLDKIASASVDAAEAAQEASAALLERKDAAKTCTNNDDCPSDYNCDATLKKCIPKGLVSVGLGDFKNLFLYGGIFLGVLILIIFLI